jgi:hypothetical protein
VDFTDDEAAALAKWLADRFAFDVNLSLAGSMLSLAIVASELVDSEVGINIRGEEVTPEEVRRAAGL